MSTDWWSINSKHYSHTSLKAICWYLQFLSFFFFCWSENWSDPWLKSVIPTEPWEFWSLAPLVAANSTGAALQTSFADLVFLVFLSSWLQQVWTVSLGFWWKKGTTVNRVALLIYNTSKQEPKEALPVVSRMQWTFSLQSAALRVEPMLIHIPCRIHWDEVTVRMDADDSGRKRSACK